VFGLLLALWFVAALLSLAIHPEGFRFVIARVVFILMVVLAFASLSDLDAYRLFVRVFLVSMIGVALLTVVQALGLVELPFGDRIRGRQIFSFLPNRTLGVPMSYGEHGILMGFAIALLLGILFTHSGQRRLLWHWGALALLVCAVLFSQSRSTYLEMVAMLAVLVGLGAAARVLRPGGYVLAVLLLLGGGAAAIIYGPANIVRFMIEVNELTVVGRTQQWAFAMGTATEHPFIGTGYGSFQLIYLGGVRAQVALHNAFINELMSVGLVLGSIYALLYAYALWTLVRVGFARENARETRALAVALIAAFVAAITALNFYQGFYVEILAVMFALSLRMRQYAAAQQLVAPPSALELPPSPPWIGPAEVAGGA
jgi:O-antigen ligase